MFCFGYFGDALRASFHHCSKQIFVFMLHSSENKRVNAGSFLTIQCPFEEGGGGVD
jgi:hypothetical protein